MFTKICTAAEAAALIKDGAFLTCAGNMHNCLAEEICAAIESRFLESGHPAGMTIMSASGGTWDLWAACSGDLNTLPTTG